VKTKVLIAVCAGALVCGAWGSTALAKSKHKARAAHTASAQTQAPTMPGNNPMNNPKSSSGAPNAPAPSAITGNNPMKVR
jgi:hypothetical protein